MNDRSVTFTRSLSVAALLLALAPAAHSATLSKANNTDNLDLASSWSAAVVPGALDIALWDSTVTGANSVLLGSNLGIGGLRLTNPGGAVTIGAGNTLTLGTSGIDLASATQDLTISSNLTLANGGQTWEVASGRTLTLNTGTFTRNTGTALSILGSGTFVAGMTGFTNTNSILGPWATTGSGTTTRYAAVSGGNLTAFTGGTAAATFGWTSANNNTWNYDVAGVQTALGVGRQANTARYTGGAGTQNWGNNNTTTITLNGLMNAGTGTLTFSEGGGTSQGQLAIGTNNGNELVFSPANADIQINIPIINTGANAGSLLVAGASGRTLNITSSGGASTYTGATIVASGTLQVSGSAGSINLTSGITVNGATAKYLHTSTVASTRTITLSRGTVDGTGTLGTVNVADTAAAVLANGNGGTTALTIGTLSFGGDATLNLSLGTGVGLNVTGTLSTTPASGTVTVNASKTGWVLGSNNLIGYGSFGGAATDFTVGTISGLGARQSAGGIVTSGNNIALNVAGDLPVWTGLNGSAWSTATTGDNTGPNNWATKTGLNATNFWAADTPEFNDTYNLGAGAVAVTNRAVDIQGANVSPGSVTFNNSAGDYTLSSSGGYGISGAASLTKSGSGKLTVTNSNAFTGATTINAGTLQLGDGTTNGNLSGTSGVTNNGTLAFDLASAMTFDRAVSGSGNVTKTGADLSITGANSYAGTTSVLGGVITTSGSGKLGAGAISLANGTTWNINGVYALTNVVTGSGAIVGTNTETVTGDFSGFSGSYTHNSSTASTAFNTATATGKDASYVIASPQGSSQGMIAGGNGNYTLEMGSLTGVANSLFRGGNSATGTTTLQVGNLGTNDTFAGILANGATKTIAVTKVGDGTWTLSGANTYTGATTVAAGVLLVNGSLGNTAVGVSGGTLGGTGSITGAVTATSGKLSPGASIESLSTGALSMAGGSTFVYEAANNSATGADLLVVNGTLTLADVGLDLSGANLDSVTWAIDDKLTLISYTGTGITGGFTGYADDTSYFFGSNEWLLDYNDATAGGNFVSEATGTSFVTMTLVPEPGAALLAAFGLVGLLRRRRA